jgi:hypothetical protein
MVAALVDILPFALGIGFFPVPIVTMILLLFSPKARVNGLGFMAGWIAGIGGLTSSPWWPTAPARTRTGPPTPW